MDRQVLNMLRYQLFLMLICSLNLLIQAHLHQHSCKYNVEHLDSACEPCDRKATWLKMASPPDGSGEKIIDETLGCFNNDPISVYGRDAFEDHTDQILAQGQYRTSLGGSQPFEIQKLGFFRYAYDINTSHETPAGAIDPEKYLDPGKMKKYYDKSSRVSSSNPNATSSSSFSADFQLLEWPGLKSTELIASMEKKLDSSRPISCFQGYKSSVDCQKNKVFTLEFVGDHGKMVQYPCNANEGINTVAMASLIKNNDTATGSNDTRPTAATTTRRTTTSPPPSSNGTSSSSSSSSTENEENLPPQEERVHMGPKVYLSHGHKSIYNNYIQPLVVPLKILLEMARDSNENSGICRDDSKDSTIDESNAYMDLRTVFDFTFATHRLILGMKCGIMIITGLETENLRYHVATLKSEAGHRKNLFERINRVSASICCSNTNQCKNRNNGIVAAYSFDPTLDLDVDKFMYISFDLGNTFGKKIIASPHSPVNIIKGLYKLYEQWDDYFEILNNPDEKDLQEDDDFMRNLREKPIWQVSTTEGKEKLLRLGSSREERKRGSLKKIAEILNDRVPKRRERLGTNTRANKTPMWATELIKKRLKEAGWQDDWKEEDCPYIPDCRKSFEYDRAVEWALKDANIHVMTAKRDENQPYCKNIVSILVIPEEFNIMALCLVGYGKLKDPVPPPEPECQGCTEPVTTTTTTTESGQNTSTTETAPVPEPSTSINSTNGTDDSPPPPSTHSVQESLGGFFAVYSFQIKYNIPLLYANRITERIFYCTYIINDIDPKNPVKVQPTLFRIPGSGTIFVTNCEGVLYLSTNFGKTIFNSVFYYEKEVVEEYCKLDPKFVANPVSGGNDDDIPCSRDYPTMKEPPTFMRSFKLCALNVPPLITVDVSQTVFLMTFGRFYARGAITYNRELRLVVGSAIRAIEFDRRFENLIYPGIATSGAAILTIALRHAYTIPNTIFKTELYRDKQAIRLVPMLFQFYKEVRNFYDENLSLCDVTRAKSLGFKPCQTISFSVHPKNLHLDLGENQTVKVRVKDENPHLPLWIFSSNSKTVEVETKLVTQFSSLKDYRVKDDFMLHGWDVVIRTKANLKKEENKESLVDAFFASDYNKLHDYSTQITLVNTPTIRCHVQPSGTVHVELGCKGKRLAAHEDIHRPQCADFKKNFQYTLRKGLYDPELVHYWLHQEVGQKKPFFKVDPQGDLTITYDYSSWGCPLEPYKGDLFIPDLRILEEGEANTTRAKRFEGKFVLIEIFGARGFAYTKKLKDMMGSTCNVAPQSMKEMIQRWKYRKRLFQLVESRQKFPNSTEIDSPDFNMSTAIRGNLVFDNRAVGHLSNIWNRANFQGCWDTSDAQWNPTKEELEEEYEVMVTEEVEDEDDDEDIVMDEANGEGNDQVFKDEESVSQDEKSMALNKIGWNPDHPRVLVFMAIALDDYDSFCTYQTMFGVSLKVVKDMDDLTSFVVFCSFVCLWMMILIGGYFARKRLLRLSFMRKARQQRLVQAAWTVIYRYEKLVHGNAISSISSKPDQRTESAVHSQLKLQGMKNLHDKRMAELRMKKTHILAQEQAKYDKLQKIFEKE